MRVFLVYAVLASAAFVWNLGESPMAWVACAGGGLLLWTLLEYLIHRFAFHGFAPHYQHHGQPEEWEFLFAPLWFSLTAAALLYPLLALTAGSWARGALVEAGVMLGYLAYEAVHVWIHSGRSGGRILVALRRHHFYHHFADDTTCYGVITPFWDRVFGSSAKTAASVSAPR